MKTRWSLNVFIILFFIRPAYSLDLDIDVKPSILIPVEKSTQELFTLGGGLFLNTGIEISNNIVLGPELTYCAIPLLDTGTMAQISGGGLSGAMFYYPGSRTSLGISGTGGIYSINYDNISFSSYWWKAEANAGIRLSPAISLSGHIGIINFQEIDTPFFQGISGGVLAKININTNPTKGKVEIDKIIEEPLYPIFYSAYRDNSFGTFSLTNLENSEIRNVTVYFKSDNFTNTELLCGTAEIIPKRKSREFQLIGDFSENLLNFSEAGQLNGEIIVVYDYLGVQKTYKETVVIPVYNRNTIRWQDPASISVFVLPNAPEILDYSKYAVGIARNHLRSGLNRNMQFSMFLFEGLRAAGIRYSNDETTPYQEFHQNIELLDFVQFPYQTLSYKLGDLDDLGLLLTASMESVGMKTAMIPIQDDFIVAYSLGINRSKAEHLFYDLENLLIINDEVWMPLALSAFREGFINSWFIAIEKLNESFSRGEWVDVIYPSEAWKTYSPAAIRSGSTVFEKPPENQIIDLVDIDILRYVSNEFGPKIQEKQREIQEQGGSISRYNSLGLLYVRAGLYEEAKQVFNITAGRSSIGAMVNLGNLALLEEDYIEAKKWFEQALLVDDQYEPARRGLEKSEEGLAYD